jgi:hypothetical protein
MAGGTAASVESTLHRSSDTVEHGIGSLKHEKGEKRGVPAITTTVKYSTICIDSNLSLLLSPYIQMDRGSSII